MNHVSLLRAEDLSWPSSNEASLIQTGHTLTAHEALIQAEVARLTSSLHRSSLLKFINFAVNVREPATLVPYLISGCALVILAVCMAAVSGHRHAGDDESDDDSEAEKEEEHTTTEASEEHKDVSESLKSTAGKGRTRSCCTSIAAPQGLTQAMRRCLGAMVISSWLHLGFRCASEVFHGRLPMPFGVSCQLCDAICYSLACAAEVAKSEIGSSFHRRYLAVRLDMLAGGLSVGVAFCAAVYTMVAVAQQLSRTGHPGGFGRHGRGAETDFVHAGPALLVCIGTRAAIDMALLATCHCCWPLSRTMLWLPTWLLPWEAAAEGASLGFWVPRRKLEAAKSANTSADPQKDVSILGRLATLWSHACSLRTTRCSPSKANGSVEARSTVENFNISGILLHLLCGAFRGTVLLITGLLVWLGMLTNAARADAVCALLVGVFVTGCVLVFLRKFLKTLARPKA